MYIWYKRVLLKKYLHLYYYRFRYANTYANIRSILRFYCAVSVYIDLLNVFIGFVKVLQAHPTINEVIFYSSYVSLMRVLILSAGQLTDLAPRGRTVWAEPPRVAPPSHRHRQEQLLWKTPLHRHRLLLPLLLAPPPTWSPLRQETVGFQSRCA